MMVRPAPSTTETKRHHLSMFLVALHKLGILQTQFRLLSGKTLLLAFWSLIPLSMLSESLLPYENENDSFEIDIRKATNYLMVFLDMTLPCCLAYFFLQNSAMGGAQLAYLPPPKRFFLFLLSNCLGCCNSGIVCYSVMSLIEIFAEYKGISLIAILIFLGCIFDLVIRFCFSQLFGAIVERFHKSIEDLTLSQEKMNAESTVSAKCNSASSGSFAIQRSIELLNEYGNIKKGLGPLLFITISAHTALLIVICFFTVKDIGTLTFFKEFLYLLVIISFIFYLIQVSEDCHEDIQLLKEIVR
jgi:hypothetical protein